MIGVNQRPVAPGEQPGPEPTLYTPGWVARRLGISATTLRSWHHRYALGPSARTPGGHRRYLAEDLERLDAMHRLVLAGIPAAEAARRTRMPDPEAEPPASRGDSRGLRLAQADDAAQELGRAVWVRDQSTTLRLLGEALDRDGVVPTWNRVALPVLEALGQRWARRRDCVDAEHLFSEALRTVLDGVLLANTPGASLDQPRDTPRNTPSDTPRRATLLAAADGENHTLALYALAAALAEQQVAVRLLGAAVPAAVLAAAIRRTAPRSVFVWSQSEQTGRPDELDALPLSRRPRTTLLVGGPGWERRPPTKAITVWTLQHAIDLLVT